MAACRADLIRKYIVVDVHNRSLTTLMQISVPLRRTYCVLIPAGGYTSQSPISYPQLFQAPSSTPSVATASQECCTGSLHEVRLKLGSRRDKQIQAAVNGIILSRHII